MTLKKQYCEENIFIILSFSSQINEKDLLAVNAKKSICIAKKYLSYFLLMAYKTLSSLFRWQQKIRLTKYMNK